MAFQNIHHHTIHNYKGQHTALCNKCCPSHTQSLQSASTRPLLRSSCSRAKFPFRAAQNTALARGVSFCKTHVPKCHTWPLQYTQNRDVVIRVSQTWQSICAHIVLPIITCPLHSCSPVKTADSQAIPWTYIHATWVLSDVCA